MARPFSSSVVGGDESAAENEADKLDSRYECAICINWLKEPVLTSCGHRFCKSCLNSWLRKNNQCCPLDNRQLSTEVDVFPDNYTRREIDQIKFKCPNNSFGCSIVMSPVDVDEHLATCPYRKAKSVLDEKCPFSTIKCSFVGRSETNALEEHLKEDMPHHLQLLLQALQQTVLTTWVPQKITNGGESCKTQEHQSTGLGLPLPPPQYANEADEKVVQAMYQRIVVLEQHCREQDVKIENLTKQLLATRQHIDSRYSNGIIVWEISNFSELVEQLRSNPNKLVYSRECYTSPYGYKFCARLHIQTKKDNLLSLHVHLMQSENDFHLEWPFKGRIRLCMIHPHDANLSQHDTIMTKPEILAFHRPSERISTRGFGFVEYANITDMIQKGFCENNQVVIKIQINIV